MGQMCPEPLGVLRPHLKKAVNHRTHVFASADGRADGDLE